ncbi:GtrA family protein [Streptomyces sp. DSM 40750]|uniref:GtrA family protein n=1 Tax=Streptomyces sp. DSM 40750 TaxID=2801030 RepID=UPI00214C8B55|nr:GtrA family protein [Streptomyces sp. DSM 40750]UUU19579.1 GtrA family protein [Streptomyces sp. DSM 40750]UUU27077.1 GtrA family protein [Streptomyces sp. DSM 40750]
MKSLVLPKTMPAAVDEARGAERTDSATVAERRNPGTPGPLASFTRFVLFGGGVGVASSTAVAGLAGLMPWTVANALITVASTLLSTELHARFTFGAGHAGWRQHWQSAGSATAAYVVTSTAVLVLHLVQPSAGVLYEQVVYLTAAGLAGVGRFLVLRVFVFAGGRTRTTVRAMSPAPARETGAKASLLFPVPAL